MARPTKYNEQKVQRICEAIESGETYERAAKIGGIAFTTYKDWLSRYPSFSEAVKKARQTYENWELNGILADAKKSLKKLICGFEYEEVKTTYEAGSNPNQPRIRNQVVTTKQIPPNATAIIFALCNRDPANWQNRVSQDVAGKIDIEQKGEGISLANVPDELLAKVIEAINNK